MKMISVDYNRLKEIVEMAAGDYLCYSCPIFNECQKSDKACADLIWDYLMNS